MASRIAFSGVIVALAATFLIATSHSAFATAEGRPNIVFVLVDDMGYADLGCYGATDIRTPNIDRLAHEGVKFTDFYANAPVCSPTRCAFMTGRWQQRVGLEWAMGYTAQQQRKVDGQWVDEPDMHALGLPTGEVTIGELMKKAGYATAAFGKWHLGFKPEYNPVRRGFDEYFGTLLGHADYYRYRYYDGTYELRDGEKPVEADGYLTDLLNQHAVECIRATPRNRSLFTCRIRRCTRRISRPIVRSRLFRKRRWTKAIAQLTPPCSKKLTKAWA